MEEVLDSKIVSGDEFENNIRPSKLDDYIGQTSLKATLEVVFPPSDIVVPEV